MGHNDFPCFISTDQVQARLVVAHLGDSTAVVEVEEVVAHGGEEGPVFESDDVLAEDGEVDCRAAGEGEGEFGRYVPIARKPLLQEILLGVGRLDDEVEVDRVGGGAGCQQSFGVVDLDIFMAGVCELDQQHVVLAGHQVEAVAIEWLLVPQLQCLYLEPALAGGELVQTVSIEMHSMDGVLGVHVHEGGLGTVEDIDFVVQVHFLLVDDEGEGEASEEGE